MAVFNTLLVEGVPGIGKSTLIDALIRRHVDSAPARKIRTLVHLTQGHTYGPIAPAEDNGTLTVADNLKHLEHIVRMIEWLHASIWYQTKPWCFVLIDTLHLTHCLRPGVLKWTDAEEVDRRLAAVGCKLLLLQGNEQTIWTRTIEDRADSEFLRYATKVGRTHEELHAHFINEQAQLNIMFERSALPKLTLSNDGDVETIIDEAFEFWVK